MDSGRGLWDADRYFLETALSIRQCSGEINRKMVFFERKQTVYLSENVETGKEGAEKRYVLSLWEAEKVAS